MNDNVKRGLRTLFQVVVGQIAAGGLTTVWNDFLSSHHVNSTATLAVGFALTAIVSWAQNELEDKTGKGILVATDRATGDKMLGTGVGAKP